MEGYNTHFINIDTGDEMTITDLDELTNEDCTRITCNNSQVNNNDDKPISLPPIIGPIDSACNGHLLDIKHLNHPQVTNVRECKGVGVQGVDKTAPPIPVLYTARHKLLGPVFIGRFGKNLFSVSRLFLDGWSMDGDHNHLHMRKNGKTMFTGYRDNNNMFTANISNSIVSANINDVNDTCSETSDSFRDWDENDQTYEQHYLEKSNNDSNM